MIQPETTSNTYRPFVLSGGGARGYAHLGVLKAFSEKHIYPEAIAATSSGSMIAAFICDGYTPDEVNTLFHSTKLSLSMQWNNLKSGLLSLKTVEQVLKTYLRSTTFEQLKIPLYITATNYTNGTRAVFSKGPIIPAIMAASSIPILFSPVTIEGIPYVDGGLSGNLPAEVLVPQYRDIIGVHVNPIRPYNPADSIMANVERTLNMAIHEPVTISRLLCSQFIEPEALREFGTFDFKKFPAMYTVGLEYTRQLLAQPAPVSAQTH
ncbi:NTE family protein [Filimonas lacunae]|uniref:NTE family protein n=1 Tax=Filimonas lacunae TaxID=477680 RepID=A0A173MFU1_9BACT|nr:patatin-like phospholipase family protein [Filimonas lacunae]BAV06492.1 hypothetical protein FLA_2511 [Filimonas lacunae]SIT27150.1 NTE family protein [Filimonas lacunae]